MHVLTSSGQSQWVVHLASRHDPCAAPSLPWCNGSSCMPDESRHQRIDALDIAHPPRQLSTPRPRQVRGLRLFTECYSTKPYVVCPRSRKLRFIYGLPVHPKKVCVVPCISSLRPSLAVRSGGLRRPSIRCQPPRAYTQLAHTRVVGVARISQPRPARVAIVGRLACAACLRSVLPTAGTCVALNLFLSTASMIPRVALSIWIDRPDGWHTLRGASEETVPCSNYSQPWVIDSFCAPMCASDCWPNTLAIGTEATQCLDIQCPAHIEVTWTVMHMLSTTGSHTISTNYGSQAR